MFVQADALVRQPSISSGGRPRPPINRFEVRFRMIETIEHFLAEHRIALIGASRNPKHFSRLVMADYQKHGYEILPVNPNGLSLDSQQSWHSVGEITPAPSAALVMVSTSELQKVVTECVAAGVKMVWLVRSEGSVEARKSAVEYCQAHHIAVIDAACPMMYLKETALPHAIHGWIWKLVGMWGR